MAFFSPEKLLRAPIKIADSQPQASRDEVRNRLARIEANYRELDSILAELESRMQNDERLRAIDDASIDFEATFGVKKKRKWRSATAKPAAAKKTAGSQSAAVNPKKPR